MENDQIKKLRDSDFTLLGVMEFDQGQIEDWITGCGELAEGGEVLSLPLQVYRRVVLEAALKAGWFSVVPDGFEPAMARKLRPPVASKLGDSVIAQYNLIYEPDENFTEPQ